MKNDCPEKRPEECFNCGEGKLIYTFGRHTNHLINLA